MDPIADMLNTLKNAQKVGKKRVAVPYSRSKKNLLEFLQRKGLVAKIRLQEGPHAKLVVSLAYGEDDAPVITGVKRLSSPGGRIYAPYTEIPYDYDQFGTIIISTSHGLMDSKEARTQKLGGELMCAIW